MARAMATRCCSPPDSCAGKWSLRAIEVHQTERVHRSHRIVGDFGDERDIFPRGQAGDQIVELEHEADVAPAVGGQLCLVGPGQVGVPVEHLAARRHVEPAENVEQRRLAGARRTQQNDELAFRQFERYVAQRMHVDIPNMVGLRKMRDFEDWHERRRRRVHTKDSTASR